MRAYRHALLALVLLVCPLLRAELPNIGYVAWYYKDATVFKRIAEYFGGGERTARKVILRTDQSDRAGLYFVCRLDDGDVDAFPVGSKFVLEVVLPDSPREKVYDYPLPDPTPDYAEIWLGLTGKDVPKDSEPPVAWRIRVIGPDDAVLASRHSYLWSIEDPAS